MARTCSSEWRPRRVRPWGAARYPLAAQQIDHPTVTAKLREALVKQIAKHENHQSSVSYAMDFLNTVGVTTTPSSWV
eukprot:6189871-Pleurochrysis_carterae.AAC.3